MQSITYKFSVAVLSLLIISSWYYAWHTYTENKEELILYVDEITRAIALPYRITQLHLEDEITNLPLPIRTARISDIANTWNNPRPDGRVHEGVDIFAERGTPVFSVTDGYVVRVGTSSRGGNFVFTVGPGGVRYYYAHLDRIAAGIVIGTEVTTDSVLGFVGNTGNASSTNSHLHFGIYDRGPKNPYPFLFNSSI